MADIIRTLEDLSKLYSLGDKVERPQGIPLTLGQSPVPQPGLQIGPSQEQTAQFVWDLMLKMNQAAQATPVMPGVTLGQARTGIVQPAMEQVKLSSDFWEKAAQKISDEAEGDDALKMFLADTGVDLFEMLPQTEGELAFEVVSEALPIAKMLAFLPPNLVKKILKVGGKNLSPDTLKKHPAVKKLVEMAGTPNILDDLAEHSLKEPDLRFHTSNREFTGDEIDLAKFSDTGAGGNFQGKAFYQTKGEAIQRGYEEWITFKEIVKENEGLKPFLDDARKLYENAEGYIPKQPKLEDYVGKMDRLEEDQATWITQQNIIQRKAVQLAREARPELAKTLPFTAQPGTVQISLEEGPSPAMIEGMRTSLQRMAKNLPDQANQEVLEEIALHQPNEVFRNRDRLVQQVQAVVPNRDPAKAHDIVNKMLKDIGVDEMSYPSGTMIGDQGFRNIATFEPEVLKSKPLENVIGGVSDMPTTQAIIDRLREVGFEIDEFGNVISGGI